MTEKQSNNSYLHKRLTLNPTQKNSLVVLENDFKPLPNGRYPL